MRCNRLYIHGLLCALLAAAASGQDYPPPILPLGAERPLFLFPIESDGGWSPAAAALLAERFQAVPESIRGFSAVVLEPDNQADATLDDFLEVLGEANVPVFLRVAPGSSTAADPARLERIFPKQPSVAGVLATGLRLNRYDLDPGTNAYSTPADVRWATDVVDVAARFGRHCILEMNALDVSRLMANAECVGLMATLRGARHHAAVVVRLDDLHAVPGIMSAMGLWLEESVGAWGITATHEWYENAPYMEPGVYGPSSEGAMPPAWYRGMILNGAMTGASVYAVEPASALWFADDPMAWRTAVLPTLDEILRLGVIPRREFVQRKAQAALQLVPADTSPQFHLNLRDLDAVLDEGLLLFGAYGLEQPGLIHELVPDSGRHYWIPVLSPSAPDEILQRFARVVPASSMMTAEEWTGLLDRIYQPDGAGTAFIVQIGRGVFVMHTRENRYEQQTYRLPRLPVPVYGASGERSDGGVRLSWPFREDDFAYRVYKRDPGDLRFDFAAEVTDGLTWFDATTADSDEAVYAVTAITGEGGPHEGTVNYGDFLLFSTVESRIEETLVFEPGIASAVVRSRANLDDGDPVAQRTWPGGAPAPSDQEATANAILGRLVDWTDSFETENLDGVMDLYATNYVDPQGWRYQYVRRAYQWFFERYARTRLHTQVRTWDFGKADQGEVSMTIFVHALGVAETGNGGVEADVLVKFPRTADQETTLTFRNDEGAWRITRSDPALPNMRELLSFSLGPGDGYAPGPDVYPQ